MPPRRPVGPRLPSGRSGYAPVRQSCPSGTEQDRRGIPPALDWCGRSPRTALRGRWRAGQAGGRQGLLPCRSGRTKYELALQGRVFPGHLTAGVTSRTSRRTSDSICRTSRSGISIHLSKAAVKGLWSPLPSSATVPGAVENTTSVPVAARTWPSPPRGTSRVTAPSCMRNGLSDRSPETPATPGRPRRSVPARHRDPASRTEGRDRCATARWRG